MIFSDIVVKYFDFLVNQFGYSKKLISDTWIEYQSKQISVVFVYDSRRSYEVSISLGDEANVQNSVPFHFLCLAYGETEQVKQLSYFSSQQMSLIDNYLKNVSTFMQERMSSILMGNPDELNKVKTILLKESKMYTQSRRERISRENADKVWQQKDYARFLEITDQMSFILSELDKRKIEFAKKQTRKITT